MKTIRHFKFIMLLLMPKVVLAHFMIPLKVSGGEGQQKFGAQLILPDHYEDEPGFRLAYKNYRDVARTSFRFPQQPVDQMLLDSQRWIIQLYIDLHILDPEKDSSMIRAIKFAEPVGEEDAIIRVTDPNDIWNVYGEIRFAPTRIKTGNLPHEERLAGRTEFIPLSNGEITVGLLDEPEFHRNGETRDVLAISHNPIIAVQGAKVEIKWFGVLPRYRRIVPPLLYYLAETFKVARRSGHKIPADFQWPTGTEIYKGFVDNDFRIGRYILECDGKDLFDYYENLGFILHQSVPNPDIRGSTTHVMYNDRGVGYTSLLDLVMMSRLSRSYPAVNLEYENRWTRFFPIKPRPCSLIVRSFEPEIP
jgi:hypothetical protein